MFGNLNRFGTFCHLIIEQRAVQRHLTTKETESWEIIYFEIFRVLSEPYIVAVVELSQEISRRR
jgi:hypothetical protein